jgi:hypothetical protein
MNDLQLCEPARRHALHANLEPSLGALQEMSPEQEVAPEQQTGPEQQSRPKRETVLRQEANALASSLEDDFAIESIVGIVAEISRAIGSIHEDVMVTKSHVTSTLDSSNITESKVTELEAAVSSIGRVLSLIDSVTSKITMLGLNASIEAARAGEYGKGFSVVAGEVKALASQAAESAQTIRGNVEAAHAMCHTICQSIGELRESIQCIDHASDSIARNTESHTELLQSMEDESKSIAAHFKDQERKRFENIALNIVQLIVRNLYERTADVRWWATDDSLYRALELKPPYDDEANRLIAHAQRRLELINQFYSVYLNLVLVRRDGVVVACSNENMRSHLLGANVKRQSWFRNAMSTQSGTEYVAERIFVDSLHDDQAVSIFATAVRAGGETEGERLGVLGVVFDWEAQAKVIVVDEPSLTQVEWKSCRVLLLDRDLRIIGDSGGRPSLEKFPLKVGRETSGTYFDSRGNSISYAMTLGYQEFDGLGWYGVVIRQANG